MRGKLALLAVGLLLVGGAVAGTIALADVGGDGNDTPKGALSVSELLDNPVYGEEVKIYGKVSLLGEVFCPCFELTSGGETVLVWYDLMVEDDGTRRPSASVEGIENGDWVIVSGELRHSGGQLRRITFWASNIEKLDVHPPTTTPTPTPPWPHTKLPKGPMIEVLAPIDHVEIMIAESWPPQYFLHVVSGLPNGCVKFDSYSVAPRTVDSDTVRVEVVNLEPTDSHMACTEVYGFVEHTIPLGSDFISGKTYTVMVNDVTETFVAQ